jgi:hypothetical protein
MLLIVLELFDAVVNSEVDNSFIKICVDGDLFYRLSHVYERMDHMITQTHTYFFWLATLLYFYENNNNIDMFKHSFLHAARIFMSFRECLVTDRRREAQEEVVADLHSCLEQLMHRSTEMEDKIDLYMKRAVYHMQLSKREQTSNGKTRERARARMYLEDKKRIQTEYDKAQRSIHMLQQQIDSIVSSQVDMAIVDALRQFNANAAKLSLPTRAQEIEHLAEELAERQVEVSNFQEAISGVSSAMEDSTIKEETDDLWAELEAYMSSPSERVGKCDDGVIIPSQHNMQNVSKNEKSENLTNSKQKPKMKIEDEDEIENILASVCEEYDYKKRDIPKLDEENIENENEKSPLLMIPV